MYEPTHKCGIGAVVNTRTPFQDMFRTAVSTQNRGYDGCGFSIYDLDSGTIRTYRRDGKVTDAFSNHVEAAEIRADRGIFGTRYITAGDANPSNLQPIAAGGYVVAHNGNILNSRELAKEYGVRVEDSDSDTRVIAEIIRSVGDIEDGIRCLAKEAIGAFNLVVMDSEGVIGAYKDPWGYHPLFGGFKEDDKGRRSVCVASEEPGLYALEIYETNEFKPGELWLTDGVNIEKKMIRPDKTKESAAFPSIPIRESACPFELSYFMRPAGSFNGVLVPEFRERVGKRMTERDGFPNNGDYIIVPVHDSGRHYAIGYSEASGIPLELAGFLGNRDMSRLYMQEDKMAKLGLNAQEMAALKNMPNPKIVKGKKVIVKDDSIVHAGTIPRLIRNLYAAGAEEVHLRIGAPPIISSCHMGMNHSDISTLRAANAMKRLQAVTLEGIEEEVRAGLNPRLNSLHYLPLGDYKELLNDRGNYCFGCFTGAYPFPAEYLPWAGLAERN